MDTGQMARIEHRTQRAKLSVGKRHWHVIEPGLAIGYRRPNRGGAGSWYVRAMIGGQHRLAALGTADDLADADGVTLLSWKHAQAAARDWLKQQTGAGPLSVTTAVDEYVANLRAEKGDRPADETLGRMRKHLLPTLGAHQLTDVTTDELITWRNGMVDLDGDEDESRRSRDTANRVLTIVKAAFNFAFKKGKVANDLAWRRVEPFKNVGQARKVILSEAEIQRLVDACPSGLQELVVIGALSGARLGEITAARVRDFDADAAILTVSGKTGERPIHLDQQAASLLRQLASGKSPQDHLLTTATGSRWTHSLHARPFAAAMKRAGLDPDTVFYSLRHTYISRGLVNGVPTKAVADHCGTSIAMLQRYYAKFIPSDQRRYAAVAAPTLKIGEPAAKVVPLRQGKL
jgi:integrase